MSIFLPVISMVMFGQSTERITLPGPQPSVTSEYRWLLCAVKTPDSWVDSKLYSDSLVLSVWKLDAAHEAFLNGVKLGGAGAFPPKYRSGVGDVRRHKIPPNALKKGQPNIIALRVYHPSGKPVFSGRAPVIGSYEHEIRLDGPWECRPGDDTNFKAAVPKPIDNVTYSKTEEASSPLAPTEVLFTGEKLSPAESQKRMKVAPDLQLEQVLTEPHIAQPLFTSWDERGRLWVVEYRQYPYPAGLEMLSRNKYYRAVYDKVPPPPPNHFKGADRISIHEDSDGDGRLDKHSVFVDGLNIATSVIPGKGGVWVLNPPYLLFYPDANRDDVPDGDPQVHLEGFGLEDTHSATNSLLWGPDGWIYAAQGCNTVAHVKVTGTKNPTVYMDGPGVWRYHPTRRIFEVFAEGGGNAFCLEQDSAGRLFSGHNGSDTRGYHYVQGGFYEKGVEAKFMPVTNPHAYGLLPFMAHAKSPRFTHALIRYEAGGLSASFNGAFFCVDPLHNKVTVSAVKDAGASFGTTDLFPAIESSDIAFRPVAIAVGPDAGVYVCDMYERYIAHGQHYQGQIDPSTGRIYRLSNKSGAPYERFDLSKATTRELLDRLLHHPNKWHRQTAIRLLAERGDKSIVEDLRKVLREDTGQSALESLWTLYQLGAWDESAAELCLRHVNPFVRLWAIRLLVDDNRVPPKLAELVVSLAKSEPNAEVRCQLAASARRWKDASAIDVLDSLTSNKTDISDPYLPLMMWWGFEAKLDGPHASKVIELFARKEFWSRPIVATHLVSRFMRRWASGGADGLQTCAQLLTLAPDDHSRSELANGFSAAFAGRPFGTLPANLVAGLAKTKLGKELEFQVRLGSADAIKESERQITNAKTPLEKRINLVHALADDLSPTRTKYLLDLACGNLPDAVRLVALAGLQPRTEITIAERLVQALPQMPKDVAESAETLLAGRLAWAKLTCDRITNKSLPLSVLSANFPDKLAGHTDPMLHAAVERIWGKRKGLLPEESRKEVARIVSAIGTGVGNAYEGRRIFDEKCGKCHSLFAKGGNIGPDLTPLKRDELSPLVLSVVSPSAEIREGFQTQLAVSADGRVITGFLVDRTARSVSIKTQDGQTVTIPAEDLESMKPHPKSLMPERLLDGLTDRELRDLFSYLRSSQPGR